MTDSNPPGPPLLNEDHPSFDSDPIRPSHIEGHSPADSNPPRTVLPNEGHPPPFSDGLNSGPLAVQPEDDVPRQLDEALTFILGWVKDIRNMKTDTLSPEIRARIQKRIQDVLTALLSASRVGAELSGIAHTWDASALRQMRCPACEGPYKRPLKLRCKHLFCEECIADAFEQQFKENASHKFSTDILSKTDAEKFLNTLSVYDKACVELLLRFFGAWRGAAFMEDIMKYHCPSCLEKVVSRPELVDFIVPEGYGATVLNNLFLDPKNFA
ncbi:hypothetical protein BDN72DRAFT_860619 [Pluteus cervinus]|uniref:Uncharacterized protein n=1 Tax=Pluteus cervinus TaxID=181527 RepID=A0ACD3AIP6_9AGAR|nr:hypothetical protein BDN72DRAFT_860619 [Pluteus cervinus]